MKIVCTSDLHGNLPPIPECDILLIAGDICPNTHTTLQIPWLNTAFRHWLEQIPAKHVVGVAGNHDLIFERTPHLIPQGLRWTYLQHGLIEIEGLKIFGMPWIRPIWGAFQRDEKTLEGKYAQIPDNVDIVISHGPPFGIGDLVPAKILNETESVGENCGSPALRERLFKIKPKLVVFGHIHEGYGVYEREGIKFVNASLMNRIFVPNNNPLIFEL